ncbi:MAG: DUF393 domain-containing protein [Ignavibacteria bacterium]|nr:DUF393 domain-containing protein [Ignavibacteria bacterium]
MLKSNYKIILFDGICNLCNGAVDFFIRHDKKDKFRFAALQSETGIELQKKFGIDYTNLESFILVDGEKYFKKSTAALKLAPYLGFPWNLLYPFIIVPPFIRNYVYDIISKYRYKWFGKKSTCRIPTPEEIAKFL